MAYPTTASKFTPFDQPLDTAFCSLRAPMTPPETFPSNACGTPETGTSEIEDLSQGCHLPGLHFLRHSRFSILCSHSIASYRSHVFDLKHSGYRNKTERTLFSLYSTFIDFATSSCNACRAHGKFRTQSILRRGITPKSRFLAESFYWASWTQNLWCGLFCTPFDSYTNNIYNLSKYLHY